MRTFRLPGVTQETNCAADLHAVVICAQSANCTHGRQGPVTLTVRSRSVGSPAAGGGSQGGGAGTSSAPALVWGGSGARSRGSIHKEQMPMIAEVHPHVKSKQAHWLAWQLVRMCSIMPTWAERSRGACAPSRGCAQQHAAAFASRRAHLLIPSARALPPRCPPAPRSPPTPSAQESAPAWRPWACAGRARCTSSRPTAARTGPC